MTGATKIITPDRRNLIEDFLLDCAHDLDDDRLEAWPGYFTDDAVYRILPRESHQRNLPLGVLFCEGRGMMGDRIEALMVKVSSFRDRPVADWLFGCLRFS